MADPGHIGIVHSNNPTPIYFYTFFMAFTSMSFLLKHCIWLSDEVNFETSRTSLA